MEEERARAEERSTHYFTQLPVLRHVYVTPTSRLTSRLRHFYFTPTTTTHATITSTNTVRNRLEERLLSQVEHLHVCVRVPVCMLRCVYDLLLVSFFIICQVCT